MLNTGSPKMSDYRKTEPSCNNQGHNGSERKYNKQISCDARLEKTHPPLGGSSGMKRTSNETSSRRGSPRKHDQRRTFTPSNRKNSNLRDGISAGPNANGYSTTTNRSTTQATGIKTATPSPLIQQTDTPSPLIPHTGTPSPLIPQICTPSPLILQTGISDPLIPQIGIPSPLIPRTGTPSPLFQQTGTPSPLIPQTGTPSPSFPQTFHNTSIPADLSPSECPEADTTSEDVKQPYANISSGVEPFAIPIQIVCHTKSNAASKSSQAIDRESVSSIEDRSHRKFKTPHSLERPGTGKVFPNKSKTLETRTEKPLVYSRSSLLQYRFHPDCLRRPQGLPFIPDITLDKPLSTPLTSNMTSHSVSAGMESGSSRGRIRSKSGKQKSNSVSKLKPKPGKSDSRRVIDVQLHQSVKLHTSGNAWKPTFKKDSDPDRGTEELFCKLRSLLNKLTPVNFQILLHRIWELRISTVDQLMGCIHIIFDKAVNEPSFSEIYAHLARNLSNLSVPNRNGSGVTFRDLILCRCQHEFEKDTKSNPDNEPRPRSGSDMDTDQESGPKKIQSDDHNNNAHVESAEEKAQMEMLSKMRSLGNIRFIGELFKLDMLNEIVIHKCILELLKFSQDEDRLEALCRLLTTVGRKIDFPQSKPRIDQYFKRIEDILSKQKISSRIRFMLEDVIELRKSHWIPRHMPNSPTPIYLEVRRIEAALPRRSFSAQNFNQASYQNQHFNTFDREYQRMGSMSPQYGLPSPPTFRVARPNFRGPLPNNARFQYGAPPYGGPQNGFANDQRRPNGMISGSFIYPPYPRYERSISIAHTERDMKYRASDGSNGPTTPHQNGPSSPPNANGLTRSSKENGKSQTVTAEMSAEMFEKKCRSFFEEYLSVEDFQEVDHFLHELQGSPSDVPKFISCIVFLVLEKSQVDRRKTGALLAYLVHKNLTSHDQLEFGLKEFLDIADDLVIDIPKIWQYLAEILASFVSTNIPSHVRFLVDRFFDSDSMDRQRAAQLFTDLVMSIVNNEGMEVAVECVLQSNLECSEYITDEGLREMITQTSVERQAAEVRALNLDSEQTELDAVLAISTPESSVELSNWMKSQIESGKLNKPKAVREITMCICSKVTKKESSTYKADLEKLKFFCKILRSMVDGDVESSMQLLYATQAFVNQLHHPFGWLRTVFEALYDEDVVSDDVFDLWFNTDEPEENAGRGVAKESVVQFFAWLHEPEESSETEENRT